MMDCPHALQELRDAISKRGPDEPNRHYGRRQWATLMACLDTLDAAIGDVEEVDVEGLNLVEALGYVAEMPIEDEEDTDMLMAAWLTADDIASRLRDALKDAKMWWAP